MRASAGVRAERAGPGDGLPGTRIARLRSEAPLVLQPTRLRLPAAVRHWENAAVPGAAVSLVAGAAGPLGGDRLSLDIEVGSGATLMVAAVAGTVVLPGPHGAQSQSNVTIRVADGGTLVWLPGTQIAAADCRHSSLTRIRLADGARLWMREELILGRHGELPGDLQQRVRISYAGAALYDQELAVGPAAEGWAGSAVVGHRRAIGTVISVDPEACHAADRMPAVPDTAVMAVSEHCLVVSSLAADAVRLRGQLEAAVAAAFDDAPYDAREVGVDAVSDAPDRALSPPRQMSV